MAERKLQRSKPKAQRDISSRLDDMEDDDVIALFNGIGAYIKEHFTEIGGEGEKDNGGSGENANSGGTTAIARFFGAE